MQVLNAAAVTLAVLMLVAQETQAFLCGVTRSCESSHRQRRMGLQMNMFDRFARVVKGNVNQFLQNIEDPEKVLDQSVADMQTDLVKIRQSYAEIFAAQKRAQKQKDAADTVGQDWYKRAQLALAKGDEELAREALAKRQIQTELSERLADTITTQALSIEKLYASMTQLDERIVEAKRDKDALVARARTAKTAVQVTDLLNNVGGDNSVDAFERMKEKVEKIEAQAEVAGELASSSVSSGSASLENRFKALESGDSVDDELARMKQGLERQLPSSSGGGSGSDGEEATEAVPMQVSELDAEYEKLKRDLGKQ